MLISSSFLLYDLICRLPPTQSPRCGHHSLGLRASVPCPTYLSLCRKVTHSARLAPDCAARFTRARHRRTETFVFWCLFRSMSTEDRVQPHRRVDSALTVVDAIQFHHLRVLFSFPSAVSTSLFRFSMCCSITVSSRLCLLLCLSFMLSSLIHDVIHYVHSNPCLSVCATLSFSSACTTHTPTLSTTRQLHSSSFFISLIS